MEKGTLQNELKEFQLLTAEVKYLKLLITSQQQRKQLDSNGSQSCCAGLTRGGDKHFGFNDVSMNIPNLDHKLKRKNPVIKLSRMKI